MHLKHYHAEQSLLQLAKKHAIETLKENPAITSGLLGNSIFKRLMLTRQYHEIGTLRARLIAENVAEEIMTQA